jgi:hypothetical protein
MKHKHLEYSQAGQDCFALLVVTTNKTYIEIGANHFKHSNNTYPLEVNHGWKGFSIELDEKKFRSAWETQSERTNSVYWDNAITFNYAEAVKKNKLPNRIGYLSCDIEPASNTLSALKKVITDGIEFDCITFEHDYWKNNSNYHEQAVKFLKDYGYKVAVENVYAINSPKRLFETWFVKDDIDIDHVNYEDWLKTNGFK